MLPGFCSYESTLAIMLHGVLWPFAFSMQMSCWLWLGSPGPYMHAVLGESSCNQHGHLLPWQAWDGKEQQHSLPVKSAMVPQRWALSIPWPCAL